MSARIPSNHFALHFGAAAGAVAVLCAAAVLLGWLSGPNAGFLLLVPAVAVLPALAGLVWKVGRWMRAPVPYPGSLTTGQHCGQSSALHSRLGSPKSGWEVAARVIVDVLMFRPLLRTTPSALMVGSGLHRFGGRWLWMGTSLFHGALLIVVLRHLRFVTSPVPSFVILLESVDSVTDLAVPKVHVTSLVFIAGLGLLLGRRLVVRRLRYVSLAADYFPLLVLILIGVSGLIMRHVTRPDIVALKTFTLSLAAFDVVAPAQVDIWLLVHVFLVSVLLAYFPVSKLMHALGALMSPTLNLANNSRAVRHINVRNPSVETLHYEDYEATFRDRMIAAGLPVENGCSGQPDQGGSPKEK